MPPSLLMVCIILEGRGGRVPGEATMQARDVLERTLAPHHAAAVPDIRRRS
ncbi:MAG TPA: hypothetical protein VGF28_06095 [Thermoanaerobaculia bacterium]|jgi:hypothetical protein